jgi:iron complex transport system ATP-binding protein
MVRGEEFAGQTFETLSQGEQKRTLIARALVNRPALIVLDEPCAGLDPASRSAFLDDLTALVHNSNAPTLVFVTHHVEEIRPWINRALVLKDGAVLAAGEVHRVLTSAVLSDAFSHPCEIHRDADGYRLMLTH